MAPSPKGKSQKKTTNPAQKKKPAKGPKKKAASGRKTRSKAGVYTPAQVLRFVTITAALSLVVGFLCALVLLAALGVFSGQTQPPPATDSTGAYEVVSSLETQVKAIDAALFSALKAQGVQGQDIRFVKVEHQRTNGWEWTQSTIEAAVDDQKAAVDAAGAVISALKSLSLDETVYPTIGAPGVKLGLTVTYHGIVTHYLIFTIEGRDLGQLPEDKTDLPRVAIVIDDLGRDFKRAMCFVNLNMPLGMAVLPFQRYTKKIAEAAYAKGRVVLLHLPMEPTQYPQIDPGRGALMNSMSDAELVDHLEQARADVPHISGVNNHMGSRLTADAAKMDLLMGRIAGLGLFFLDSRTTVRTKAFAAAGRAGVKRARRAVFLDNVQDEEAIRRQLARLVTLARQNGKAVAIGHPYTVTCDVLEREFNNLAKEVNLLPITELIE